MTAVFGFAKWLALVWAAWFVKSIYIAFSEPFTPRPLGAIRRFAHNLAGRLGLLAQDMPPQVS